MVKLCLSLAKFLLVAFIALLFNSCDGKFKGTRGNGHVVSQTREMKAEFHSVSAHSGVEIIIKQAASHAVTVETDDNIQPHIITRVEDGVLIVETEGTISARTIEVKVEMPVVNKLEAAGGVSIKTEGMIDTNKLIISCKRGSSARIEVEADQIVAETRTGSSSILIGKTLNLDISSSEGSENDASRLLANDVRAQASHGSSLKIHPIVSLEADASSGASILYRGSPKKITKDESSGGSISAN